MSPISKTYIREFIGSVWFLYAIQAAGDQTSVPPIVLVVLTLLVAVLLFGGDFNPAGTLLKWFRTKDTTTTIITIACQLAAVAFVVVTHKALKQ